MGLMIEVGLSRNQLPCCETLRLNLKDAGHISKEVVPDSSREKLSIRHQPCYTFCVAASHSSATHGSTTQSRRMVILMVILAVPQKEQYVAQIVLAGNPELQTLMWQSHQTSSTEVLKEVPLLILPSCASLNP